MWLPIYDKQDDNAKPVIIIPVVILACVAIQIWMTAIGQQAARANLGVYGLIPAVWLTHPMAFITSVFFHADWMHLLGNLLFLYVFGDNVEQGLGSFRFLIFFLLAAVASGGIHVATNLNDSTICIGASGAISGVLGAYMMMFPWRRVTVMWILPVPSILFLGMFFILQINQWWAGSEDITHVAYGAHIGGFGFGMLYGWKARGLLRSRKAQTQPIITLDM